MESATPNVTPKGAALTEATANLLHPQPGAHLPLPDPLPPRDPRVTPATLQTTAPLRLATADAIRNAIPEPVAMMEATVNHPNHLPMGTYHLLNPGTLVEKIFASL